MIKLVMAFFLAFAVAYVATPQAIRLAHKLGAIDVPKDGRRVHKKPIPRMGGMAIFAGFLVSALIFVPMTHKLLGVLVGTLMIVGMGLIDDVKPLKAKTKLLIQVLAAGIAVYSGIRIEWISNPFDTVDGMFYIGWVGIPLAIFWIVGITNTVNLIDGLDGLAAGVSAISAITMAFVAYGSISGNSDGAYILSQTNSTLLLLALAGGAVGFLPYNFNPAKIFMGDTGSLFLGYTLSIIAIDAAIKSAATLAIAIPVLALGIPIFDTTFAIIRRANAGKPIMEADKGHLHHRLLGKGLSQKKTVLILYAISGILGLSAVLISQFNFNHGLIVLALDILFIYYGVIRLKMFSE